MHFSLDWGETKPHQASVLGAITTTILLEALWGIGIRAILAISVTRGWASPKRR